MTRRNVLAAIVAVVAAAVCIRLGFWQLERLGERRSSNELVRRRFAEPPVPAGSPAARPESLRFRRVRVDGVWDFDREIVLSAKTRDGSPGVHIVTPIRPSEGGPAVLVNRGWVYSPDAMTVDLERWREPLEANVTGYVEELAPQSAKPAAPRDTKSRTWRFLYADRVASAFPEGVAPYYVVALTEARQRPNSPVRLPAPAFSDGPHRSYAVQWFSFAVIAVVGVAALSRVDTLAAGSRKNIPGNAP
ncbi:MAG: SURF1 family protein [Gemmatimonadaceae bacterium]